jgi:hypothetical protein
MEQTRMNPRIKQLAQQAKKVVGYTDGGYTEIKALDQEKFAELLVAECNKISNETCKELKADESLQTPGSKINWNLYNVTLRNKLAEHFRIDL